MKITIKELTVSGLTAHSIFSQLPFKFESGEERFPKPVLAYQTPSCIKIVGNIHYFLAAKEFGHPTIPAYLIQDSDSTLELLQLVIDYYTPMNLIDKALLCKAAIELGLSRSMLAEKIFPLLELAPRIKLIDQILFLLQLPDELQTFILEKDLSLKRALIFQRASDDLDWVTRFVSNLKIGINMTAEIIQNIWEMAQRDNVDFKTKAKEMGLWTMADHKYEDNRQAIGEIRKKISQARFPTLTQAGKELSRTITAVQLPDTVKIKWDPYFERQGVDVAFHVKDPIELELILKKLATPSFMNIFEQI